MMQVDPSADAFDPRAALGRVGEMAVAGVLLSGAYLLTGIGIPCIFKSYGMLCPFCGGTRMVASLLQGRVAESFAWNPMLFSGGVLLVLVCLAWLVEWAGGPALRWPRAFRPVTQTKLYVVAGVIATAFMVLRNVL